MTTFNPGCRKWLDVAGLFQPALNHLLGLPVICFDESRLSTIDERA